MEGERFKGTVLEWSSRGFGFIGLEDGRRAYVHHSEIGGGNLGIGEAVTLAVAQDRQNPEKLAALDVQREAAALSGPRIHGHVSTWNARGFGFVDLIDGRRAYVHASQVDGTNLREGQAISCTLVEDQQNPGKWAAMEVQAMPPQTAQEIPWHPHSASQTLTAATPVPHNAPTGYGDEFSTNEERYEGSVVEWNERGFGFIMLNDGRRVYVHSSAFGGGEMVPGLTVNCVLRENLRHPGKLSAVDVQLGRLWEKTQVEVWPRPSWGEPAPAYDASVDGHYNMQGQTWAPAPVSADSSWYRVEGRVAEWNDRGFGFIDLEDKRRAYVHVSECLDGNLCPGEVVSCVVEQDTKNPLKWAAKQVHKGTAGEDCTVSSWNHQGGFGFVNLDDGRRAYIHISAMKDRSQLEVGERLRVITKPDERNSSKLCVAGIKSGTGLPNDTFHGDLGPVAIESIGSVTHAEDDIHQKLFKANVIEWSARGYGFVSLEDGRRAYVHHSVFGEGNLVLGEPVAVKVVPDLRNSSKLMVKEMTREQGFLAENSTPSQDWHAGTICTWSNEAGSGILEMDDGRFVEVTHETLGSDSVAQGQRCEVIVPPDTAIATCLRAAAFSYSDDSQPEKRRRVAEC